MNIIGLYEGHTTTAALMRNGEVVACASEERFNRKKAYQGYPRNAINYLLTFIEKKDIDLVVFGAKGVFPTTVTLGRDHTFSVLDFIRQQKEHFYPVIFEGKDQDATQKEFYLNMMKEKNISWKDNQYDIGEDFKVTGDPEVDIPEFDKIRKRTIMKQLGVAGDKIEFVDHHVSHANYAYFASPFRGKDCVVITADGDGDSGINATISLAKNDKIEEIFRTGRQYIGKMWRYVTLILGMKPQQHEYKVMGLAPYADQNIAKHVYNIYKEHLVVDGFDFKYKKKPKDLYFYFRDKFEGIRFDGIASGVQRWTEEILEEWFRNIIRATNVRRIVFSGGISMNIKVNKVIHEMPEVDEYYVAPSGGDESLAIGGCYARTKDTPMPLKDIYMGPEYSDSEVLKVARDAAKAGKYEIEESVDMEKIIDMLIDGKTLARFSGRMEFGARALGNRSIIADPSNPEIVRKINTQIKKRDFWMPFTPAILKEREKDYIVNPKNIYSPFMTIAFDSTELARKELIGAMHPYDQTVRPQIVEKERNPDFYSLIKSFEKKTGIGGVLNTSFNLHGDAIVLSPKDAVYTMDNSSLDMLLFNDKILLKRKPRAFKSEQ